MSNTSKSEVISKENIGIARSKYVPRIILSRTPNSISFYEPLSDEVREQLTQLYRKIESGEIGIRDLREMQQNQETKIHKDHLVQAEYLCFPGDAEYADLTIRSGLEWNEIVGKIFNKNIKRTKSGLESEVKKFNNSYKNPYPKNVIPYERETESYQIRIWDDSLERRESFAVIKRKDVLGFSSEITLEYH